MKQQNFSNIAPKGGKQSLTISKAGKQPLTKSQLEFNKLTQRIEKLQKELEKKQVLFDEAMKVYSTELHPLQKEMAAHRRQMLDVLWEVYKSKAFSKADQASLKEIVREQLQEVFQSLETEPDDDLKRMYQTLEGETYAAAAKREEAAMKQQMQDMFDDIDVDIDLDEVDIEDKSTIAEKMAEAQQKMKERQQEEENRRQRRLNDKKKTAKQLEQEQLQRQVDEMKQKNISTIYKQLAKLFHPDLEQDEVRRAEKEILMKELTAAYEAKNLHALLTLELKWIHKENDHLESLTEEKLAVYLQILREQAQELESEKYQLVHHPRYSVLVQMFGPRAMTYPLKTVQNARKQKENDIQAIKRDVTDFQSSYGLRYIKAMIKEWKQMRRYEEDDEELMLQMLFGK